MSDSKQNPTQVSASDGEPTLELSSKSQHPTSRDALTLAEQIGELFDSFRTNQEQTLSALQSLVSELALSAAADDLTGTLRRGPGLTSVRRELDRARRTDGPLSIVLVDLDHLKTVNDVEGHLAGDAFIADAVRVMKSELRTYDLIVRYGGDEFLCCLPNARAEEACQRFESMRRELGTLLPPRDFTFGCASADAADTVETLIARADHDLFARRAAKRRNRRGGR